MMTMDGTNGIVWRGSLYPRRWFLFALWAVIPILAIFAKHRSPGGVLALLAIAFVPPLCLWRIYVYPTLCVTEEGVLARNPVKSVMVPWSDMALTRPGAWGLTIQRKSGGMVHVVAVQKRTMNYVMDIRTKADAVATYLTHLAELDGETRSVVLRCSDASNVMAAL